MKLGDIITDRNIYEIYSDPSLRCKTKYIIHYIKSGQPQDHVIEGLFTKRQTEEWEEIVRQVIDE